jgi:hypothetical protein
MVAAGFSGGERSEDMNTREATAARFQTGIDRRPGAHLPSGSSAGGARSILTWV